MQKSHFVLGVAAVVAVLVGVVSLQSSGTFAPNDSIASPLGTAGKTVLVTYGDRGFTPSVIRIDRGTSVRIFNTSGKALRVTPHTDAAYAKVASKDFIASKSIKIGESFEISVVNPGVWGFTNLNSPGDIGIAIVE